MEPTNHAMEPRRWAEGHFGEAPLTDVRRVERLKTMAEALAADPGASIPQLFARPDEAPATCPKVDTVLVVQRTGGAIPWQVGRDHWYHEALVACVGWVEAIAETHHNPRRLVKQGNPRGVGAAGGWGCEPSGKLTDLR